MKHTLALIAAACITLQSFADINFIELSKISSEQKYTVAFNDIKDNEEYYNHWSMEWNYNLLKEDVIKRLREHYSLFSSLTAKNTELYLLLGDIAHYLYNLDNEGSYEMAIENYTAAIKSGPGDYRCYWFLGHHYGLTNGPVQSIENFEKAFELMPATQPAAFWNSYAWSAAMANMPSSYLYATEKIKSISREKAKSENPLDEIMRGRIEAVDKDKAYKKEEIWTADGEAIIDFTCRPLGIKILVDTAWIVEIYDYDKGQSAFVLNPPNLENKEGTKINYTIAILMKTAGDKEKLDDYINKFVGKYKEKTKISFSDKYEKMIAWEIKDKTMYPDMGGAHLYMLGIERTAPEYPGLLLERPSGIPPGEAGQTSFYQPGNCKDRFKGKIFYAIMLDTCEDIHEGSLAVLKSFFGKQVTIE